MKQSGEIIIYDKTGFDAKIEVKLIDENVWLNQNQLSNLFDRDRSVITRHINNIFKEKELSKKSNVQKMHISHSDKPINYYNLDVIISLGYRVKSKTGTQFRIWANKILKQHLIKGYTQNEMRLNQLKKTIQLVQRTSKAIKNQDIGVDGFIDVLTDYSQALDILDDYDHQRITKNITSKKVVFHIDYNEAISAIDQLRNKFEASNLFGNEKDESFKSSIAVIDQTFNGNDLYPSIEEKAANLLYLVVKNHSFTDGNKRIAAWLFVWYLDKNEFLYKNDASKKITNSTLVALTLMIAESNPKEKDLIINIIINLINSDNE